MQNKITVESVEHKLTSIKESIQDEINLLYNKFDAKTIDVKEMYTLAFRRMVIDLPIVNCSMSESIDDLIDELIAFKENHADVPDDVIRTPIIFEDVESYYDSGDVDNGCYVYVEYRKATPDTLQGFINLEAERRFHEYLKDAMLEHRKDKDKEARKLYTIDKKILTLFLEEVIDFNQMVDIMYRGA